MGLEPDDPLGDPEADLPCLVIIREITERKQAEALLEGERRVLDAEVAGAEGIVAELAVPIGVGARIEGLLYVANRSTRTFTDRDEAILTKLADHAAVALGNAALFARERMAHAEAEASRRRFRDLVDGLDAIAWEADAATWQFTFVSRQAEAILGYPVEQWLAEPDFWVNHLHPDDREHAVDLCRMATAEVRGHDLEYRALAADGRVVWLRDIVRVVPDADGRPRELRGVMVDITAQKRAEEAAQRRRREAEVVAELARRINVSLDLDDVLQRVADGAKDLCGGDVAYVALREAGAKAPAIRYLAGARAPEQWIHRLEPRKGVAGQVLLTGRPYRTDNYAEDPRLSPDYVAVARTEGIVSALAVPIHVGDRVAGLIYVATRTSRVFTDHDEAVLEQLGDHAALAIQNARLYAEAERRRRMAEGLAGVGRLVSQSLDAKLVARRIAESVCALLDVGSSVLYRLDAGSGDLVALATTGAVGPVVGESVVVPRGACVAGLAVREGRPVFTPDPLSDPRIALPAELRHRIEQAPFRSMLAVPLTVQGQPVGALVAADRAGRTFTDDEVRLLEAFADQAAVALKHAELFRDNARRLSELLVVHEVARAASAGADLGELARVTWREAGRTVDARNMVITLYDHATREFEVILRMLRGEPDWTPPLRYPFGRGLMSRIVERHEAIRTADYAGACRREGVEPVAASLAFPHWLGVPMIAGGRVIGALALRSADRPFTADDERLLADLASFAALAVTSARRAGG